MGVDNAEHAGVLHGKAGTHQAPHVRERPEGAVAAPWFRSMRQ